MENKQPYVTHDGKIGVRVTFLISTAVEIRGVSVVPDYRSIKECTYDALKKRATRTPGLRLREGKGAGNEALFSFENMPVEWQRKCIDSFGDPQRIIKETAFLETFYQIDYKASDFYSTYKLPSGKSLDKSLIQIYTTNASLLNAVQLAMTKRRSFRKVDKPLQNDPPKPSETVPLYQRKVIPFCQSKVSPFRQAKVIP
ncbi:hypothetical protein [Sphingobacterium bovistauri]|uniref:Phage integrase SAM-like domain-containing protein n=1 Tax=Sphingobacterium bovistauri TaxID=2781959 RepID=A0ABS7Z8K2_9SPHI|nr:hypothetical protein [Sphingobacterium bovistauri]MCA5006531.1 hypothetical protein [Sphingobacterium bovistauri]